MMPDEFRQYAELWQDQIDPEELAQLQAMAQKIERTAWRKWLIDMALGLAVIIPMGFALWTSPASLQIKLGFVPLGAGLLWAFWRRHQITRAARATAIDDPRIFFEKAIKNVRAEINFYTISLCLALPALVSSFLLMNALHGLNGVEMLLRGLHDEHLPIIISILAVLAVASGFLVRDHIKSYEQLRRLESMSREWEARDADEGP